MWYERPLHDDAFGYAMPLTSDELLARFDSLGLRYTTHTHPPLFTVEDAKALRGDLPGGHVKNLFLRDKAKRFWLLTTLEDAKLDLKALAKHLDAGRFTFANEEQLMTYLGIAPGAVSPLAAVNDTGLAVTVVLDSALLTIDPLNLHPLRNDRTTAMSGADLVTFLKACGHAPRIMTFADARS
jgi:Ala-tRNA(Pro) deacylase